MSAMFGRAAAALCAGALAALAPPAWAASYSFETVALSGQPVPGLPGLTWSGFTGPALNGAGDTAFLGGLAGAGVTSANNSGIFAEDGGTLGLVAREGDAAPGAGGAVFSDFGSAPALNGAGDTAFLGNLTGAGVTSANNSGIFAEDGGTLGLVVRAGDAAPGAGGAVFSTFGGPALDGAGDTAFFGALTGAGVTGANDSGLFAADGGTLGLVVREGDAAPGAGGAVFSDFGNPALNGADDKAFIGFLSGAGVTSANQTGVFAEDGGTLGLVVREGDAAPGAGGAVFSSFGNPALNGAGDTAFVGALTGAGVTGANDSGLFSEDGGTLGLVAREGDAAPGAGGAVFLSFLGTPALNGAGDTAFLGFLTGAGVTSANDVGLFAELGGTLGLVVREGDQVEVLPGDLRTITGFTLASFGFLNDAGQLAFRASFSDGSQAIIVASLGTEAQVPLPASALLLAGALGLMGWRARRPG